MKEGQELLSPEICEALADLGRRNLYFLAKWILGYKDMVPHIHGRAARILEDRGLKKVATIMPRGFFKSSLWSIAYPIWEAINDPNVRILISQNTYSNAIKKLQSISSHFMENQLFRVLYRQSLPTVKSIWRADSMHVPRSSHEPEGTFEAAGVGTKTISRHYDIIVEDDTVAPEKGETGEDAIAPTSDQVENAIAHHQLLYGLQSHPTESRRLVVGTRWFERDLLSWIREREKSYVFYERAARENAEGLGDPQGQPIFPERFSNAALDDLEESYGPYIFSCLYMNKPTRGKDMCFQPEMLQYYDKLPRGLITYTTVDPAGDPMQNRGKTDWNVVMTCGKDLRTGNIYVIAYDRKQCNPGELIEMMMTHQKLYKPIRFGVETVGYQQSILYYLRERKKQEFVIFPVEKIVNSRISKPARIRGLEPVFLARKIFLAPWMNELKKELLSFPLGKHDDCIDALSMQLGMWRATPTVGEKLQDDTEDPMSFNAAVRELEEKANRETDLRVLFSKGSELYDMQTNSRRAAASIVDHWARRHGVGAGGPANVDPSLF